MLKFMGKKIFTILRRKFLSKPEIINACALSRLNKVNSVGQGFYIDGHVHEILVLIT